MSGRDYQYAALPSAESHIRLLNILPRENGGPIKLTLKTLTLDDAAGNYDAISYTWGNFLPVHKVLVDGKRFWLRDNMWRFLRQCSSTDLGKKVRHNLWIDSVCINQKDAPEKNAQVQRMAAIFSQAKRVIVWLGMASQTSSWTEQTHGQYFRMAEFMREAGDRLRHPEDSDLLLKADIRRLMVSPYWSRLWIVQELALAQQVVFVSGKDLCDLMLFLGFATLAPRFFRRYDTDNEDLTWRSAASQVDRLVTRHLYKETQSAYRGLAPLVESFAAQQCHDPHDHVYGLLGLLEGNETISVDYGIDMELLFWQVLEVTHQQVHTMSSGVRRNSYQWNLEKVLQVLGLEVNNIFQYKALQQRLSHDRFAVEMKNNGCVNSSTSVFSFIVTWYFYGDLSILVASDLSSLKLAYVWDPLNEAYAGDIFNDSVESREIEMPEYLKSDVTTSIKDQSITHDDLMASGEAGASLSIGFSFRSLVHLSRLSVIGNDFMQPAKTSNGLHISGARDWPDGFPWPEILQRAEQVRTSMA